MLKNIDFKKLLNDKKKITILSISLLLIVFSLGMFLAGLVPSISTNKQFKSDIAKIENLVTKLGKEIKIQNKKIIRPKQKIKWIKNYFGNVIPKPAMETSKSELSFAPEGFEKNLNVQKSTPSFFSKPSGTKSKSPLQISIAGFGINAENLDKYKKEVLVPLIPKQIKIESISYELDEKKKDVKKAEFKIMFNGDWENIIKMIYNLEKAEDPFYINEFQFLSKDVKGENIRASMVINREFLEAVVTKHNVLK